MGLSPFNLASKIYVDGDLLKRVEKDFIGTNTRSLKKIADGLGTDLKINFVRRE